MSSFDVKEETWINLAKLSQESVFNRRDVEWKTAFGLWTAIGAWTYFAVTNADKLIQFPIARIAVLLVVLWLVLFVCWQLPIRRGFEDDKRWKHYYMKRAAGEHPPQPEQAPYCVGLSHERHLPWTVNQLVVTGIFFIASYLAVHSAVSVAREKSKATRVLRDQEQRQTAHSCQRHLDNMTNHHEPDSNRTTKAGAESASDKVSSEAGPADAIKPQNPRSDGSP